MAVLKAFVCQVILLGLYKLFLEQVVEDHLVPDELTRNCLVGFVCLVCFGIQLYTDNAEDEDNAEADENPKSKSQSKEAKNAKKSESAEISAIPETVGSSPSCRVTATKLQTTSQEITTEEKRSPNDKEFRDSKEKSKSISSIEAENVTEVGQSGIFVQFSPNMSDTIPKAKVDGKGEAEVPASTAQTSYDQETTTIPVLNGFSETNVCEESDEDGIEIDRFVAKESSEVEVDQLTEVKPEEVEPIPAEDVTEEIKQFRAVEVEEIKPKDVTEVVKQLRTVEGEGVKSEDVTEAVVESECLATEEIISSTQDLDEMILNIEESSEVQMTNGIAEESLTNVDKTLSNIIEGIESKKYVKDEGEIGNGQEITLSSEPDENTKDITESLQSAQEMSNTSSTLTKAVKDVETMNKNNADTSILLKTAVSLPSEKLTVSTARQKVTTAEDVCVAPITIDISFIYACH